MSIGAGGPRKTYMTPLTKRILSIARGWLAGNTIVRLEEADSSTEKTVQKEAADSLLESARDVARTSNEGGPNRSNLYEMFRNLAWAVSCDRDDYATEYARRAATHEGFENLEAN